MSKQFIKQFISCQNNFSLLCFAHIWISLGNIKLHAWWRREVGSYLLELQWNLVYYFHRIWTEFNFYFPELRGVKKEIVNSKYFKRTEKLNLDDKKVETGCSISLNVVWFTFYEVLENFDMLHFLNILNNSSWPKYPQLQVINLLERIIVLHQSFNC